MQQVKNDTTDFRVFLTIFTRVVTERYPDIRQVNRDELRDIGENCITLSDVAIDIWDEFSSQRRQRPTQRAA